MWSPGKGLGDLAHDCQKLGGGPLLPIRSHLQPSYQFTFNHTQMSPASSATSKVNAHWQHQPQVLGTDKPSWSCSLRPFLDEPRGWTSAGWEGAEGEGEGSGGVSFQPISPNWSPLLPFLWTLVTLQGSSIGCTKVKGLQVPCHICKRFFYLMGENLCCGNMTQWRDLNDENPNDFTGMVPGIKNEK